MGQPDGHCGNHRGGGQPGGCSEFKKHLYEEEGAGVSNPRGGSGEAEDRGGNRARELEEYRVYVQTKQYIEEIAKQKLGLVNPDEILLKPAPKE